MKLFSGKIKGLPQKTSNSKAIFSGLGKLDFATHKKKLISIDWGESFVKIVYIGYKGAIPVLLSYDLKKVLSGQEGLTEIKSFISDFLRRNDVSTKEAILTVSSPDSLVIKLITLSSIPEKEIPQAVKWQLKDDVQFDIEKALMDTRVLREYTDANGVKKSDVVCVFAKREFVDKYLAIVIGCGLSVTKISVPLINYTQILNCSSDNAHIFAVLDIGYNESTLCVFRDNKPCFMRTLSFSSDKVTQSLTGALMSDKGKIELSLEKAEEIKKEFGIPQDNSEVLKDNIPAIYILSLMRPQLENLVKELRLSLNYFAANSKEDQPSLLYVTGGGANLRNLSTYLAGELNVRIEPLPLPECIVIQEKDKENFFKNLNQFSSALGAAFMKQDYINLVPYEIKAQKTEVRQKAFFRIIAVTSVAVFLFLLFIANFHVNDYKKRVANAKLQLSIIELIKDLNTKIEVREKLLVAIQRDRAPVYGLLKLISSLIPKEMVLDGLFFDRQKQFLTLKGIILEEGTPIEDVLTGFMGQLEKTSYILEANLVSSRHANNVQQFEIQCDMRLETPKK
ncbi:MAG: pilus assembly protein PilM [Candidatus Omnitrophota bacterium]